MDYNGLHSRLLADSDMWSELLSTLFILLFIAVPAILRAISEAQSKQKARRNPEHEKIEDVSKHKIGPQGLGPAEKGPHRRHGTLTEWDRRQEQIRQRMNKLKEQAESKIRTYQQPKPQKSPGTHDETARQEVLPVSQAIPEKTVSKPPVYKPTKPAPTRLPEKMRQYVQATQTVTTQKPKPVPQKPKPLTKTKLVSPSMKSRGKINPVIERIVRSSNPLRTGIILKEILDKPKGFQ
jgi:hypothetical protein